MKVQQHCEAQSRRNTTSTEPQATYVTFFCVLIGTIQSFIGNSDRISKNFSVLEGVGSIEALSKLMR